MMRNLILFVFLIIFEAGSILSAQSTIKGEIKDSVGNPVPFIQVLLKQDDRTVNITYTDDDLGYYRLFGVSAGVYDIIVGGTPACSNTHTIKGINVSSAEVKFIDILFNCSSDLQNTEIQYVPPKLSPDIIDDRGIKNKTRFKKHY